MDNIVKELKVGDVVYIKTYGKLTVKLDIERITKTMAVSGNYRFKKQIRENGYIEIKCYQAYSTSCAYLANADLDAEWKNTRLKYWFDNKEFTTEEIQRIFNLLII